MYVVIWYFQPEENLAIRCTERIHRKWNQSKDTNARDCYYKGLIFQLQAHLRSKDQDENKDL